MAQVKVCNMLSQVVMEREMEGNVLSISTSDWSEGLYVVTIRNGNGTVVRRVSIVH